MASRSILSSSSGGDEDDGESDKQPILAQQSPDDVECNTNAARPQNSGWCNYPNGVVAVTAAQALLATALVLSLLTIGDCFLVVTPDDVQYEPQLIPNEPPNQNNQRGLGFFFWETVSGQCSWSVSQYKDSYDLYATNRGVDWWTPRMAALVAAGLSWLGLLGAVLLSCVRVRRKCMRAILCALILLITPVIQSMVWTVLQTQVCRFRGCRPGRTAYFALGAVVCSMAAGAMLCRAQSKDLDDEGVEEVPTPKTDEEEEDDRAAQSSTGNDIEQPSVPPASRMPPSGRGNSRGSLSDIPEGSATLATTATVPLADKLQAEKAAIAGRQIYTPDEASNFSPAASAKSTPQRSRLTYENDSDVGSAMSFSKNSSFLFGSMASSLFGSSATGSAVPTVATRDAATPPPPSSPDAAKNERASSPLANIFGSGDTSSPAAAATSSPASSNDYQLPNTSGSTTSGGAGGGVATFQDDGDDSVSPQQQKAKDLNYDDGEDNDELVFPSDPFFVMQDEEVAGGRDIEILLGGATTRSDSEPDSPQRSHGSSSGGRRRRRWIR